MDRRPGPLILITLASGLMVVCLVAGHWILEWAFALLAVLLPVLLMYAASDRRQARSIRVWLLLLGACLCSASLLLLVPGFWGANSLGNAANLTVMLAGLWFLPFVLSTIAYLKFFSASQSDSQPDREGED